MRTNNADELHWCSGECSKAAGISEVQFDSPINATLNFTTSIVFDYYDLRLISLVLVENVTNATSTFGAVHEESL